MADFSNVSALLEQFAQQSVVGCSCAVSHKGKTVFEGYAGYADKAAGRNIDKDTVYRLFSMTKVIVCTAALKEFEKGRYLLNDPFYEYFPAYRNMQKVVVLPNGTVEFRPLEHPILVKDVFSMSMGFPYAMGDSVNGHRMQQVKDRLTKQYGKYTLQQEINAMAEVPVAFEPGTHFLYGYGHELVAGLLEVVSGKTVGEYLKQEIFEPLGMESTGYRYFGDIRERMSLFYEEDENGELQGGKGMLDEFHEPDALFEHGGGGLFSTTGDYLAFATMMANGGKTPDGAQIISPRTIDLMRSNQLCPEALKDFRNDYHAGYGYGLGVRTLMEPGAAYYGGNAGEFGWTGAGGTYTLIDPTEQVAIVYMHQRMPNLEREHHHRIRNAVYAALD